MNLSTVLIVEDVPEMQELLRELVKGLAGVTTIRVASNTAEARFELSHHKPDIVLLDEVLPGESSQELGREIQGLNIVLVWTTGYAGPRPHENILLKPDWKGLERGRIQLEKILSKIA